jgi:hypothetical protein
MPLENYEKMLNSLTDLEEEINKEREEIWKISAFISSLRSVVSYLKTGNPYPDEVM